MKDIILNLLLIFYACFVLSLFSYIIFWKNHSGWWIIIPFILLDGVSIKSDKEQDE